MPSFCRNLIYIGIPFVVAFLFAINLNGQIGITAGYNSLNFNPEPSLQIEDQTFEGYSLSIFYWFRLRNVRVEFLPGVSYTHLDADAEINSIQLFASTRVYPFSFYDDCDCPTFSKSSGFFKDGFFLSLSPYIGRYEFSMDNSLQENHTDLLFHIDVGAGLDIGFSDQVTLTPEVRFRYLPKVVGLVDESEDSTVLISDSMSGLYAGISLIYRWDQ